MNSFNIKSNISDSQTFTLSDKTFIPILYYAINILMPKHAQELVTIYRVLLLAQLDGLDMLQTLSQRLLF